MPFSEPWDKEMIKKLIPDADPNTVTLKDIVDAAKEAIRPDYDVCTTCGLSVIWTMGTRFAFEQVGTNRLMEIALQAIENRKAAKCEQK